jgi:dTDP-N-acetylfucosamine:lipid II N-acetylfucosaminyltransferase
MRFLHVMVPDKFIPPFIRFVNENFNPKEHLFLIVLEESFPPYFSLFLTEISKLNSSNIVILNPDSRWKRLQILMYMYGAEKIIIHGLWSRYIVEVLFRRPQLLEKSYWIMWGGDFYFPEQQSFTKKWVIKNIGYLVTYMPKQVEYVRNQYGAKGKFIDCLFYPDGAFQESLVKRLKEKREKHTVDFGDKGKIRIQVGNSATETNRHEIVFKRLREFFDENKVNLCSIEIIVPLSYGDISYRDKVIALGKSLFGDSFKPVTIFLDYEKYLELLLDIDIGIFYHNRQQGLGNIIQLLGMGKKVYITTNTPQWDLFTSLGVGIYDFDQEFDLTIDKEVLENNSRIIRENFTLDRVKRDWEKILKDEF